jgi:hypothetical protein
MRGNPANWKSYFLDGLYIYLNYFFFGLGGRSEDPKHLKEKAPYVENVP